MPASEEVKRPPSLAARCRHYAFHATRQLRRLKPAALQSALQTPATRQDVVECYRAILGRDPESLDTAAGHLLGAPLVGEVITKLSHSSELRARHLRSNVAFDRAREPNYLARSFTGTQRVQAYYGHYGCLVEALSGPTLDRLISSQIPLYVHDDEHRVVITGAHDRHEEGELQLQLWNAERVLYVMGVTIVRGEVLGLQDRHTLLISRLQGIPGAYFEIRRATKRLGDIHPKAVLLTALEGLAAAFGVNAILGVAASNQVASAKAQPGALTKGYDDFFLLAGAERLSDRFFLLRADRQRLSSTAADRAHVKRAERKRQLKREIQSIAAAQARTWFQSRSEIVRRALQNG